MTLSKREYATKRRKRNIQLSAEENGRKKVVNTLHAQPDANLLALSKDTGISRSTIGRISAALKQNNQTEAEKLVNVRQNCLGVSTVLSHDEEMMICERLQYCATRGFPVYDDELPALMGEISSDSRHGYKNLTPSPDTVRYFRARHADKITLRVGQDKDKSKLLAEHLSHAATLRTILKSVIDSNPHFKTNPAYLWNMDETEIGGRGRVRKMYCSAGLSSTGYTASASSSNGAHLTCVVTTSPSGHKLPPFFIIAGKRVMKRWWDPLPRRQNRQNALSSDLDGYFRPNWMPKDAGIAVSENGSMTKEILPAYIEHFSKHARKYTDDANLPLLLLLDGHKSRKGLEWLHAAIKHNIEIIQSPANTSHYLQSNDQNVNLILNRIGKLVRDQLIIESDLSPTDINFKLVKAVHGYKAITELVVKSSWERTGLRPMNFRFVQIAENAWEGNMISI